MIGVLIFMLRGTQHGLLTVQAFYNGSESVKILEITANKGRRRGPRGPVNKDAPQ
jgi:hypothetical protein